MFNALRHTIKLLPALAATAAVAAVAAPTASADSAPTAWLQSGVLSYAGTSTNDRLDVSKVTYPSFPGGYALKLEIYSWPPPYYSANCTEGGPQGHWIVMCPALSVSKLTYDGKGSNGGDSFFNNTSVPSVAHGGPGHDIFHGGDGPDVFYGGGGTDELYGNYGDDVIDGGPGTDIMGGGSGGTDIASWADANGPVNVSMDNVANDGVAGENDYVPKDFEGVEGSPYGDKLSGRGLDPDTLLGGNGPDDLEGYGGDDVLKGEAGNDTLHPNSGSDVLDGGADSDALSYGVVGQSVYVYQDGAANDGMLGENDNVTSIENLTGSIYNDDLEGTSGDDIIDGNEGGDKIDPKFGDDTVYGGDGPDNISGGPGAPTDCGNSGCTKFDTDTVWGGDGADTIDYSSRDENLTIAIDGSSKSGGFMEKDDLHQLENVNGGSGDDTIYGNDDSNSLGGGSGSDGIVGRKGNDYISGGQGNDFADGENGNDYVVGGEDDDMLEAAGGDDTLYGGSGRDRVSYDGAKSRVVAHIGTGTSGSTGEADTIEGDVEDLEGSAYADRLYGSGVANLLIGDGAADLLVGSGGADTEQGGAGADTLRTAGDGSGDHSSCGTGADVANADKIDSVDADCETVNKS
jgi:Ca2+-binding RTX toxin-like protein